MASNSAILPLTVVASPAVFGVPVPVCVAPRPSTTPVTGNDSRNDLPSRHARRRFISVHHPLITPSLGVFAFDLHSVHLESIFYTFVLSFTPVDEDSGLLGCET